MHSDGVLDKLHTCIDQLAAHFHLIVLPNFSVRTFSQQSPTISVSPFYFGSIMRINTNKVMVPDDILPQDGVWMWPEPGTWTGEDVFKLLDWMVSFNGIEYLAMNSQQPASICINNKIQSLTHPIPLLEDCHTIVQALGGPDLRVNHNNFYEESWRAASRSGNTYRGTVYACSNSHDGIKGIEIFFTCRPQHTLWMGADVHPQLRTHIDQTNNGMSVIVTFGVIEWSMFG